MLSISRLSKHFVTKGETVLALDDVSVEIERGSFFTLLGPSGCGKSTLLRCLAGLEQPTSGEIRIEGRVVFSGEQKIALPANKRNIGMVFQSYAIWPHMSVFANVAFPLEAKGKPNIRERTMQAIALVGLQGLDDRNAARLSGGQQQRVALARAIVADPDILLLDEPLSNLDAGLRDQMRAEIRSLQKKLGITTICVTHDQNEALSMSDRVAIMSNGRFIEVASPEDVYERPKTVFAAQFIGGANILEGSARPDGGTTIVETAIGPLRSADRGSGKVTVFIRPEHIVPVADAAPSDGNRFDAMIAGRRFVGGNVELDLAVGTDIRLRGRCAATLAAREGDRITLSVGASAIRILTSLAAENPEPVPA